MLTAVLGRYHAGAGPSSTSSGLRPGARPVRLADAEDMRVHRHGGLAPGHVEHDVGCLAADARQRLQRLARTRHAGRHGCSTRMAAGLDQVLRLGAEESDAADEFGHLAPRPGPSCFCGVGASANRRRVALLTPDVGGLRRQQHRGQKFKHARCTPARSGAADSPRASLREEGLDVFSAVHRHRACPPCCRRVRAAARLSAASITARLRSPAAAGSVSRVWRFPGRPAWRCAFSARRSSCSRCSRSTPHQVRNA